MITGTAKVATMKLGSPCFAQVDLRVDLSVTQASIDFCCSGKGFVSQGVLEEVPSAGYASWKDGARVGLQFALKTSRTAHAIVVERIAGLSTDTNPSIVAVAAARALWNAIGFEPPVESVNVLEALLRDSWKRGPDHVPALCGEDP